MKIMHNPEITARIKVEEYLEKQGKELVNFVYGSNDIDERRSFVGISYFPVNDNTVTCYSPNRYNVITYDIEENIFECNFQHLDYAAALHFMGEHIRIATSKNK